MSTYDSADPWVPVQRKGENVLCSLSIWDSSGPFISVQRGEEGKVCFVRCMLDSLPVFRSRFKEGERGKVCFSLYA